MTDLVVATRNAGKLREIRELLKDFDLNITSLGDYENLPVIVEDGRSFEDNARLKALTISRALPDVLVLGEDSGLEVDALGGQPGVFSARFAGENADDTANNEKLLTALQAVSEEDRTARYHCCAVLSRNNEVLTVEHGLCEGRIACTPRGSNGFGYDPLFLIPEYDATFGEISPRVKAMISHRAQALRRIKTFLSRYLQRT